MTSDGVPVLPAEATARAIAHMNDDHAEDCLLIVRSLAEPAATAARMTGIDGEAGTWLATVGGVETTVRIPWPSPIVDRSGIRDAVVELYHRARRSSPMPLED